MRWKWIALLALTGPSGAQSREANIPKESVEVVSSVQVTSREVTFGVISHGCTKHEHFDVRVRPTEVTDLWKVLLIRTKPDHCESTPHLVEISFSREEIGLAGNVSARVSNPVGRHFDQPNYYLIKFRGASRMELREVDPFEVGDVWTVLGETSSHPREQVVLYFPEYRFQDAENSLQSDDHYLVKSVNPHYWWMDKVPSFVVVDRF